MKIKPTIQANITDNINPEGERPHKHLSPHQVRKNLINGAYKAIVGKNFNKNATNLQYFIFDGILKEAALGHSSILKFNLQTLAEDSPDNIINVAKQIQKIGHELHNTEIENLANQYLPKAGTKSIAPAQFVDHAWLEEQPEPSFLGRVLKTALIGTLMIGSGVILTMEATRPIPRDPQPTAGNNEPPLPEDICTISEFKYICEKNLGIERINMPQVPTEAMDNFSETLKQRNITLYVTKIKARDLTPVQSEMNADKVLGMIKAAREGKYNPCTAPVLITSENSEQNLHYVIDGHHRYAACRILDGLQTVTMAVGLAAREALRILDTTKGVTKAGL